MAWEDHEECRKTAIKLSNEAEAERKRIAARIREITSSYYLNGKFYAALHSLADELEGK